MDFEVQGSSLTVKLNKHLLAGIKKDKYAVNGTKSSIDHLKINCRSDQYAEFQIRSKLCLNK